MGNPLPAIEDLVGAFQSPNPNPLYGAQYVTPDDYAKHAPQGTTIPKTPIWIDANGNDVTTQMNAIPANQHSMITSQPFKQGGFFRGLGSIGMAEKQANMQAEQYPGQQAEELASKLRASQGMNVQSLQNRLLNAKTIGAQPPNIQRILSGLGDLNPTAEGEYNQMSADQMQGVPDARALALRNQALQTAAAAPVQANPAISQTAVNTAMLGAGDTAGALQRQPYDLGNKMYASQVVDPMSMYAGLVQGSNIGLGGGGANMVHINPDGTSNVAPNPLRPPMAGLMAGMTQGMGGRTMTAPSGAVYHIPDQQQDLSVPPISYQQGMQGAPYGGSNPSDSKGGDSKVSNTHPNPVIQAGHDSDKAQIDAKVADLKAQKKALEANHISKATIAGMAMRNLPQSFYQNVSGIPQLADIGNRYLGGKYVNEGIAAIPSIASEFWKGLTGPGMDNLTPQ